MHGSWSHLVAPLVQRQCLCGWWVCKQICLSICSQGEQAMKDLTRFYPIVGVCAASHEATSLASSGFGDFVVKVCWRDQALGECYSSKADLGCSTHQEEILCEASCCCKQCSFERWVEKISCLSWESLNCVGLNAWAADKQLLECCGTWLTSYMSLS